MTGPLRWRKLWGDGTAGRIVKALAERHSGKKEKGLTSFCRFRAELTHRNQEVDRSALEPWGMGLPKQTPFPVSASLCMTRTGKCSTRPFRSESQRRGALRNRKEIFQGEGEVVISRICQLPKLFSDCRALLRHSGGSRNPGSSSQPESWTPAFAGETERNSFHGALPILWSNGHIYWQSVYAQTPISSVQRSMRI